MTDTAVGTTQPLFEARSLTKSFGPVRAVKSVSIQSRVGEVLGLVGENGAGKSTLLNMISGTTEPDSGELLLGGQEVNFRTYQEATQRGVFRIFQHQALVPNLSVAANVFLAQESKFTRFGVLDSKRMRRLTQDIFDELGIELRTDTELSTLKFAERQVVEIVRSLAQARLLGIEHPVILYDEPTSALSREQIEFFFGFVRKIQPNAAQVFVSHRLEEIIELCDRMIVLKDGEVVSVQDDPHALSETRIHELMVGRKAEAYNRSHHVDYTQTPRLEVEGLTGEGFADVSLRVMPGEVLGIAGVVGSGKSEFGRAVFELGKGVEGRIEIDGKAPERDGSRAGIRARLGYVPTERHKDGLVLGMSVAHNLSLPEIGAAIGSPVINNRKETANTKKAITELGIRTPGPDTLVSSLSGGNQQKVLLARWTTLGSRLLVLDNPTNGVDVGAKAEIYRLIESLTETGVSVVLISDDLPEILALADRIVVMKDGQVRTTTDIDPANPPSEVELVAAMV
ncbi:sugar ABC transporter ATP-binding protein [Herbiconiux solani]|uniref:sugar ABC transporter ATP-binding protein n=1 Tax=Herbiconiux solani TaxID=661329 RepID=UPI000825C8A0|nr:sugar ABC transporter ATP-binding protein [Herbiconiux solani]